MIRQVILSTKHNSKQSPHVQHAAILLRTSCCNQLASILSSTSLSPSVPSSSSNPSNHSYHTATNSANNITNTTSSLWKKNCLVVDAPTSNNNSSNSNIITTHQNNSNCHYFSSMPPMTKNDEDNDEDVLTLPPNLKLDPRAISTPIYGLTQIGNDANHEDDDNYDDDDDDNKENDDDNEEKEDNVQDTNNNNEQNGIEESDDASLTPSSPSYSLTNQPDPVYTKPLPDRLHVPIIDLMSSSPIGTIHLSSHIFGNDPIRTDILHRCVIYQRNKKRGLRNNGARTKTISEVSGSGNKVRAQKGGGVARAGHKRPPHWRGGAKAHGPKGMVQNYETKLNKKVRMMGVRMALSQKLKEGNLILVNSFEGLGTYKTKVLKGVLEDIGDIAGRYGCTAMVVDHVKEEDVEEGDGTLRAVAGVDVNLQVASGNLHKVKVRNQKFVNVYDLLKYEKLVLSLSALEALEERYDEN